MRTRTYAADLAGVSYTTVPTCWTGSRCGEAVGKCEEPERCYQKVKDDGRRSTSAPRGVPRELSGSSSKAHKQEEEAERRFPQRRHQNCSGFQGEGQRCAMVNRPGLRRRRELALERARAIFASQALSLGGTSRQRPWGSGPSRDAASRRFIEKPGATPPRSRPLPTWRPPYRLPRPPFRPRI